MYLKVRYSGTHLSPNTKETAAGVLQVHDQLQLHSETWFSNHKSVSKCKKIKNKKIKNHL